MPKRYLNNKNGNSIRSVKLDSSFLINSRSLLEAFIIEVMSFCLDESSYVLIIERFPVRLRHHKYFHEEAAEENEVKGVLSGDVTASSLPAAIMEIFSSVMKLRDFLFNVL